MLTDEQKAVLESTATGSTSDDVIILGGETIQLDLGNMGAAQSTYSYPDISGTGTISISGLDLTSSYSGTTITLPSGSATCYTTSTGYNWSQPYSPAVNIDNNGVNIKEGGDIKIGNKSLSEAIQKIEERLAILKPNPEMEEKWDELRSLGERYRALEKELYEKEKMWEILKRDE